eukprot:357497-Chlamydomonas_euryale.AAC.3
MANAACGMRTHSKQRRWFAAFAQARMSATARTALTHRCGNAAGACARCRRPRSAERIAQGRPRPQPRTNLQLAGRAGYFPSRARHS